MESFLRELDHPKALDEVCTHCYSCFVHRSCINKTPMNERHVCCSSYLYYIIRRIMLWVSRWYYNNVLWCVAPGRTPTACSSSSL
jgi:hypothetical protein